MMPSGTYAARIGVLIEREALVLSCVERVPLRANCERVETFVSLCVTVPCNALNNNSQLRFSI